MFPRDAKYDPKTPSSHKQKFRLYAISSPKNY